MPTLTSVPVCPIWPLTQYAHIICWHHQVTVLEKGTFSDVTWENKALCGRVTFKRILKTCGFGYGWKRDLVKGWRNLGYRGKVGNWNTVSFPVAVLQEWVISCRWISCNKYRNNDASPFFFVCHTEKMPLCLSSEKGVRNCSVHWLGFASNGPGLESRARYLTPVQNVRTGREAHPASGPMGDPCSIPGVKRQGCTKFIVHHRQVLRLRMNGSLSSLAHKLLWRVPGQLFVN